MKTGIIAFTIAVVLLMVTVQTAMAGEPFDTEGNVLYESGTEFPHGATVQIWNMNHPDYVGQPWTTTTQVVPPPWDPLDYRKSCEYGSTDDLIKVRVTSPDGTYVGENISRWGDVQVGTLSAVRMDITMYLVPVETENFTKSLLAGWNLISLPLTALDNSTSAVLGNDTIEYDAVKQYDATTKTFADATTMDPGIGYFVHVKTAGDWVYEGTAVDSTSTELKAGLNMIGVLNCTKTVSDTMSSIAGDYRYVARWDASLQEYKVYNPSAPSAFYGFTEMTAGEGYFVSATDCTLNINCTG